MRGKYLTIICAVILSEQICLNLLLKLNGLNDSDVCGNILLLKLWPTLLFLKDYLLEALLGSCPDDLDQFISVTHINLFIFVGMQ